jgi:hypothetical protein
VHDESRALTLKETKLVQEVVGCMLYYTRAVDPTIILHATNKISIGAGQPHCWTKSSASCTMSPHSLTIRLCSISQKCTSYSKWMHLTSHGPNPDPSLGAVEYGTAFLNAQHGVWLRTIADEMGHQQPPTPLHRIGDGYNKTAPFQKH